MTGIVEQLRMVLGEGIGNDAADEIERLRLQRDELLRLLGVHPSDDAMKFAAEASEHLHIAAVQRNELLAALTEINNVALGHPYAGCTCGDIARAAITKAEEGK